LDAELFGAANPVWKRRLGWIAYLPAAAAALRMAPSEVHIVVDREVVEARSPLVLIANGGSAIAPNFRIYPGVAVDDGLLDVLVFTSLTATQVVATLGDAGRQRLNRSPYVIHRRGQTVSLQAEPTLRVQLDGDPRGTTPRQFSVVPSGLLIVTPQQQTVARPR
jgi:diacylglycerol kinase family enzyme